MLKITVITCLLFYLFTTKKEKIVLNKNMYREHLTSNDASTTTSSSNMILRYKD